MRGGWLRRLAVASVVALARPVYADCADAVREACVAQLNTCLSTAMAGTPADREACWDAVRACLLQSGCTCPPDLCPTSGVDADGGAVVAGAAPARGAARRDAACAGSA
jgi:hypothetical protein